MTPKIFNPDFGIFHDVSDNRYHNAYDHGHADGEQAGYAKGMEEGISQGYAQGKQDEYERLVDPNKIIEATVTGRVIAAADVSEIPHTCTVKADRATTVTVCGKNLIDPVAFFSDSKATTLEGDVFTTQFENGGVYVNRNNTTGVVHPKGTYTATFLPLTEGASVFFFVYSAATKQTIVSRNNISAEEPSLTFTAEEDFYLAIAGNHNKPGTYSYRLQLELGRESTAYAPYAGAKYALQPQQDLQLDSSCPYMTLLSAADAQLTFTYRKSYGMQTQHHRFWDSFQQRGQRQDYDGAFMGKGWRNATFAPRYDLKPTTAYKMFRSSSISGDLTEMLASLGVVLDTSQLTNAQYMFSDASGITRLGALDFRNVTNGLDAFAYASALKTIDLLHFSETTNISNAFHVCSNLKNITIAGVIAADIAFPHSSGLSAQSVQSVIDHLADLTGKTAKKLTFHATVGAKLTDVQKAAITAKNWTLVY